MNDNEILPSQKQKTPVKTFNDFTCSSHGKRNNNHKATSVSIIICSTASIIRCTFTAERQKKEAKRRANDNERLVAQYTPTMNLLENYRKQIFLLRLSGAAVCRVPFEGGKIFIFPRHQLKTFRQTFAEKKEIA